MLVYISKCHLPLHQRCIQITTHSVVDVKVLFEACQCCKEGYDKLNVKEFDFVAACTEARYTVRHIQQQKDLTYSVKAH